VAVLTRNNCHCNSYVMIDLSRIHSKPIYITSPLGGTFFRNRQQIMLSGFLKGLFENSGKPGEIQKLISGYNSYLG